jgi:hypothetical protein
MMKHTITLVFFGALACRAADNLTPIDAKPGLWETTTTSVRSGMPPIPADALAKMPPDQRARIEAQIGKNATPTTETKQSCITPDDVAKGFGAAKFDSASCKRTIATSTGSKLEVKWECAGDGGGGNTGTLKVEAIDSTHVKAHVEVVIGSGARAMNMKVDTSAKWLSNSCGDVKPNSAK